MTGQHASDDFDAIPPIPPEVAHEEPGPTFPWGLDKPDHLLPDTRVPWHPPARPAPAPEPVPCRCDSCKYDQRPPGAGVVLYSGPGGEDLRWNLGIRDGRYEDVSVFDSDAWHRIHAPAIATAQRIERSIETGFLRAQAVAASGRKVA